MTTDRPHRAPYDVSLSYASEDRDYVSRVAAELRSAGVSIFYDRYEEVTSWGKNLVEHLEDVYRNQSRFVVIFISKHYVAKAMPTLEVRSALARAIQQQEEYVLPARFDDTPVPGLQTTTAYVDCGSKTPTEMALLIRQKIESATRPNASERRLPSRHPGRAQRHADRREPRRAIVTLSILVGFLAASAAAYLVVPRIFDRTSSPSADCTAQLHGIRSERVVVRQEVSALHRIGPKVDKLQALGGQYAIRMMDQSSLIGAAIFTYDQNAGAFRVDRIFDSSCHPVNGFPTRAVVNCTPIPLALPNATVSMQLTISKVETKYEVDVQLGGCPSDSSPSPTQIGRAHV